ncbi:MAG TPA: glycerate kinase, partial [Verrucomicrobiae bacterium]|nr:glycerate kinase [Verrucomicrobiae bacterium]
MPLNVLIVPDKFKGTLTAQAAAEAIAHGWRRGRPQDTLELLPMSDGGDGFGEVISGLIGAKPQNIDTLDAAHRPCRAQWWWEPKTKTAVIESARIIGLAMLKVGRRVSPALLHPVTPSEASISSTMSAGFPLSPGERAGVRASHPLAFSQSANPPAFHPFNLDTFGLGAVIQAAARKGATRCLMGIGGSATNDGGFGVARALGWTFLDAAEEPITQWTGLHSLAQMKPPQPKAGRVSRRTNAPRWFRELLVAVDVQNPLLGARGC